MSDLTKLHVGDTIDVFSHKYSIVRETRKFWVIDGVDDDPFPRYYDKLTGRDRAWLHFEATPAEKKDNA